MLEPHLPENPRPLSSFQICSSVKEVATDTLKEPLRLHHGGSKIKEALSGYREIYAEKKRKTHIPFMSALLKIHLGRGFMSKKVSHFGYVQRTETGVNTGRGT